MTFPRNAQFVRHLAIAMLALGLCGNSDYCYAQAATTFDPFESHKLFDEVSLRLENGDVDSDYLTKARTDVLAKQLLAESCESEATGERNRLEALYEPLKTIDGNVDQMVFTQYLDIKSRLDEAISRQAQCRDSRDFAAKLIARIADYQTSISQQFLSHRDYTILGALRALPHRLADIPNQFPESISLDLLPGITAILLFWVLVGGGTLAAVLGVFLRHRFYVAYEKAGGDDAPPQFWLLLLKPLADHGPLLLEGITLTALLLATLNNASAEMAVIRLAIGISMFGLARVIIDWATGPMSPSGSVKGLVPDHVKPFRRRLQVFAFMLVASFVVLGTRWLAIRTMAPDVPGRATMLFLVAASLLYALNYLGRIPGLTGKFRLIRSTAALALMTGIVALLVGYHNFAGYLIHGITRSALALFLLWILLWCVLMLFELLMQQDSASASQIRRNLGVTDRATRVGLGFMQLIADLVVWLGFIVFLIYVWDASGATLDTLYAQIINGVNIGGQLRLRPLSILNGIVVFVGMLIVIGWIKRWIDRRWLQKIVIERGARDALLTVFGYVGFIIAVLVSLAQMDFDLTGLAWVSGALALGIGFGMQEIANNFVSGLILLFERPIRTGDFVSVGDTEGFVRSIRIRATEIETLDNQAVLVPNSELISGRVTNWVLRDTAGRLQLRVGVAYGSDVEKVREILEAVGHEHPEVITDGTAPAPRALFMGFGDSSLDFELRIRVYRVDRRYSVISDLNFLIDKEFREAGIAIPFPQRDLHIISTPSEKAAPAMVVPPAASRGATQDDSFATRTMTLADAITRSFSEQKALHASPLEVWAALTSEDLLNKWLTTECKFDARIGGQFTLMMKDGFAEEGRIDVFIPGRRLRLASTQPDRSEPLSTGPITTEFRLRETAEGTELSVLIAGIPADEDWEEDYNRSQIRWRIAIEELAALLGDSG